MYTNQNFINKIKAVYSIYASKKNTVEDKENFIYYSLHQMGYYSIASYFPNIVFIADPLKSVYSDEIILSFANYYAKNKLSEISSELVDKNTFIEKWKCFITALLNCPSDIGAKTNALRKFYIKSKRETKDNSNFKNKAERFWTYYVSRKQKNNSYRSTPNLPCLNKIHCAELPFYFILYTIYYLSNINLPREEPFDSFADIFHKYQKYGDINTIISWCIQCYYEWFLYYKDQPSPNTHFHDLCYHISGLPMFLEHFGYYWHKGIQWHKRDFIDLLNNYDYNLYEDDSDAYVKFLLWIISTHRNYTQPKITNKKIYIAPNRNGEMEFSSITSYIQYYLEGFFQCPKDELRKHFKDDTGSLTSEFVEYPFAGAKEDLTEDSKRALIAVKMKELFASIFLNLADADNDFLHYINLHIYFYYFIQKFSIITIEHPLDLNEIIDHFENWFFSFTNDFHKLNTEYIYQHLLSHFMFIQSLFPSSKSDCEYYLYKLYLESF